LTEYKKTSVISYQFIKKTNSRLIDKHYSETILFDIENTTKELNLKDKIYKTLKYAFRSNAFVEDMPD
jgi:hypothetical protein